MKNNDPRAKACKIFFCDRKRGAYCCRKCDRLQKCGNPCLNSPDKCGQYTEAVTQ